MIKLRIDTRQWRSLARKIPLLGKAVKEPRFLDRTGTLLRSAALRNIEEGSADGKRSYALLSPSTLAQKKRKGYELKPLVRSGEMQQSIQPHIAGGKLTLGSKAWLRYHQFGTKKMPARPVYYLRKEDWLTLGSFLKDAVKRFLR